MEYKLVFRELTMILLCVTLGCYGLLEITGRQAGKCLTDLVSVYSPPHELPHRDLIQLAVDEFFCPKVLLCKEMG